MQEWHPSRPLPEKALDALYYFTEQSDRQTAATKETPDHTYNWNLFDYPEPWEIEAPVLSAKHKKNIIVSNLLAAKPEVGRAYITLLLELAQRGFSLYVLTQTDRIVKIDPKKIREDISYLNNLCARSHLLHAQAMRSKLAKSKHPKNPITFSDEFCFILDHYQTEKIKHAWQDEEGSPFDFRVTVRGTHLSKSKYLKFLKSLRDHVEWSKTHLILEELPPSEYFNQPLDNLFPGVKKITVRASNNECLKDLPADLEELSLESCNGGIDLSGFNKLLHLTLTKTGGYWKGNLPNQLQTLRMIDVVNSLDPLNLSACHQLKKIEISNCPNEMMLYRMLCSIPKDLAHPVEFHFGGDNPSICYSLRSFLTTTRFSFRDPNKMSLRSNILALGGPKVTDLSLFIVDINTSSTLSESLRKARFEQVTNIPPSPDTLEDLTIIDCELWRPLPSHLKKATFRSLKGTTEIDVSNTWQLEYLEIINSPVRAIKGFTSLSRLHTLILDCQNLREFALLNNLPPSVKYLELIDSPVFKLFDFSDSHLESFSLRKCESSQLSFVLPKTIICLRLESTSITSLDLRAYTQLRYVYLSNNPDLTSVQLPAGVISVINNDNPKIDIQTPNKLHSPLKNNDSHPPKKRDNDKKGRLGRIAPNSTSKLSSPTDIKKVSTPQPKHLDNSMDRYTLERGTHIDPNKVLEVRYKIYSAVDGSLTPLPASTYRKLVCDRVGWSNEPELTISSQDLRKPLHIQRDAEYTTEDLAWLKPDEHFVKRPLEVKEAGTHRILLDTLTPYDELIDIFLPPQSKLLFNPTLNTYVLEWETNGPQKATIQYRFREASPPDIKHLSDFKQSQAPTLDKNLREHLETLFSAETHPENASQAFLTLKQKLSEVLKQGEAEKLAFCRKELAEYCTAFGSDPLKEKEKPGGWEELEEILIEAKGACRYQAMIFVMLCHFLGVEARYIANDIHAFVELRNTHGIWETLQLGGHETQLKYTDQPLDLPKPTYPLPREAVGEGRERGSYKLREATPSGLLRSARNDGEGTRNDEQLDEKHSPTTRPTPHIKRDWKPYFASQHKEKKYENLSEILDDLHGASNPLVTLADNTAAQQLYAAMANHLAENKDKKPILYIESPSDLHAFWRVCHIPEGDDDTNEAENAPLREIIEKGGTVMINWERFNATQMDSYKTLMDDPPSFKGVTIAVDVLKDVHFIHMVTPKTLGSGAFLSRTNRFVIPTSPLIPAPRFVIPARMPGPRPQEAKLSHPCELDPGIHAGTTEKKDAGTTESDSKTTEKKDDGMRRRIDLYGSSSHWETQLVGTILPSDDGFTFNSGTLTEIAKAPSSEPVHVELVDPPKDPRFQAFMTRLSVNHGFIANGRSRTLPEQFSVSNAAAPEVKTPTQLAQVPAATWNPDEIPQNVFVLNSSRLPHLFQEQALKETKEKGVYNISTEAGWLPPLAKDRKDREEKKSTRQIIQTAPISDGERRRILHAIAAQDETIEWVDLSQSSTTEMKPLKSSSDIPNKNAIIQTPDPEFVAQGLVEDAKDKDNIVNIPIYSTTTSSELLESIDLFTLRRRASAVAKGERLAESDVKEQKSHIKKPPQFSCKTQPMLQALREGKTVVLHGQLSAQVYESLQTLFLPNPYLTLSTFPYTQPIKGRLIVLSDTLPQATVLAQLTQSQTYLPQEALWEAYEARLNSSSRHLDHSSPHPGKDAGTQQTGMLTPDLSHSQGGSGEQDSKLSRPCGLDPVIPDGMTGGKTGMTEEKPRMTGRLKSLYALANLYSPEQPPFISYDVLCQCLEALEKDPTEDNPIKPWFQNEEQGSTNYAQLNVLAKLFVGPDAPPTVRTEKLKRYSPQEEDDVWRRLNCLSPSALRQVIFGKKDPSEKDYASLKVMDNKTLLSRLNSWLKKEEYKPRQHNPDPHAKVMARMRKHLQEKNAVVLKGPPGSGKTWAAYQYADEVGSPPFLANDPSAIEKWKKHQPASGEKAVLIVDEANLKRAGYWESLAAHISATHQVIFTRNPNSYGGRVPHRILQTIPTVTVKKWTPEGLLQHILVPLCKKVEDKKAVTDPETSVLKKLITVYEFVKDHSPKDALSIRDLQQLTLRWLQHPQKATNPEQAAYDACWQEWGLGFKHTELRNAFTQTLRSLREVSMTPSPYPLPPLRGGEGVGKDWPSCLKIFTYTNVASNSSSRAQMAHL